MMPGTARSIVVLGIGNTLMGDDGMGVLAVEPFLDGSLGSDVEVVIGETAGMGLMKHFRTKRAVVWVDALNVEGAEPGAVFRFTPGDAGLSELRANNIHGMGLPHIMDAARLLGSDPDVVCIAVQVVDVRQNDRVLSPVVAAALPRVRELVAAEVTRMLDVPQAEAL